MNHSGVDVPDKLKSSEWERCPDRNGRPVIRFSNDHVPWILWQGANGFIDRISLCQYFDRRGWYRAVLEEASQVPTEIQFFLDDREFQAGCVWIGVELKALQSVDRMIDRFGQPPQEVRRDWNAQWARSFAAEPSSALLSHFLVARDGRLFSLSSIEAIVWDHLSNNTANPTLDLGIPIPDQQCLRDAPQASITASGSLEELLNGDSVAVELDTRPPASNASWEIPDRVLSKKSSSPSKGLAASTLRDLRHTDRPSPRDRNPQAIYSYAAIGAALLVVIVGLGTWMSRPTQQVAQLDPGPAQKNDSKSEGENFLATEVEQQELLAPLEFSGDLPSLPDSALESQASSSLESLMGQITGGRPLESIDSISFESVTEALNQTNDEAIVQESLMEVGSENPLDLSKTAKPFGESLDEAATQEMMEDTTASAVSSSKEPVENPIAPGLVAQSLSIQQAQFKTKIVVPFRPNDRQAVCRVKLEIADDLLLKPAEAVELVGRQDTLWTIALNDDSVHLNIYLRSIPAKSWYIATAVRLKLGNGVEIPISKSEATQVCLRLQNYLRWLDQSRHIGESMRHNRKTRSMAISGLEQIEKQTKSTEKSLKNWLAIEKLVQAFYEENTVELELASSSEMLPVR